MIIKGRRIVNVASAITGNKVLIHGDSITADAGASTFTKGYVNQYKLLTGFEVRTMAQYGRSVQENIQSYNVKNSLYNVVFSPTPDQLQYNPVFDYDSSYRRLIFRFGANDILQKPGSTTNVTTFKNTYKQCLQVFLDKGWPSNKIALINIGSYLGGVQEIKDAIVTYNDAIKDIGTEMNFQVVDLYTLDGNNNRTSLYGDDVHPNDSGHLLHAQYIASILN